MSAVPLLQVALDFVSLPSALVMAYKVADEVDIVEVGAALCKAAGIEAVRAVREICPDKLVLADLKTVDGGGCEAQMAFDAGADLMTVSAVAPLATIRAALAVAKRSDQVLLELTGVREIQERAREWRDVGVERLVYHRGWDEEAYDRSWSDQDLTIVRSLIDQGFKMTVTGGITIESLPLFQDLPVSIVIAGRAIHQAKDPAAAAHQLRVAIARLWASS